MAKWGEGDPRWIVEERPDATNVNNWHWTEKNADAWSKAKLAQLFENMVLDDSNTGIVTIEKMEKCTGEARANNRKAKLIFFYEWELELTFKGRSYKHAGADEVKGKITIPNLSEEHTDMKDVDVDIAITSAQNDASRAIKEMLRVGPGAAQIRVALGKYVECLRTEFSQGLILPAKDKQDAAGTVKSTTSPKTAQNKTSINTGASAAMKSLDLGGGSGSKIEVSTIECEEHFKCTGQELYNALTQRDMLQVFTGSRVAMADSSAVEGQDFSLLDGVIEGKWEKVKPFSDVVQKWRLKTWPAGHFSHVEIKIRQTKEDTRLTLKQTQVPEKELEKTKQGWQRYYWEAIRRAFGFGGMAPY